MGIIYMLTSPSKKKYIGQTIRKFEYRWAQHKKIAKENPVGL
jgi:predicted GIY-YIG superfamily endonuclease